MGRLRFAGRSLRKSPLVSLVVVLSLGLGIGVNTAIFSLLNQVVLSSLPVPHPEQLALVASPGDLKNGRTWDNDSGGMDYIFNWRTFRELEKHTEAASVIAFRTFPSTVAFAGQTLRESATLVSGQYFSVMGVRPFIGRLIAPEDDAGANPVAVLAYRYWQEKLAGANVINQTIKVNGQPFIIVGIAPQNFTGTTIGNEPAVYVPIALKPRVTEGWNGTDKLADYWIYLIARLHPGVTRAQAEAALNIPFHGVAQEMASSSEIPADKRGRVRDQKLTLVDGRQGNSGFRADYRSALGILILATGLVLLIAMANAANLLLARSVERRKELVIRAALGAGRGELMGQFLTEAVLLASMGGAAGVGIAVVALKLLIAAWGGDSDSFAAAGLNWPVLLFSVGLSLATGVLFGLYPALDASRISLTGAINNATARASESCGAARFRKALVCAQVSISVVLLIPTGLFLKSVVNLLHVDLGMRTANTVVFQITPIYNGYKPEQSKAIFERAESGLAAIPGVRSAVGSMVPLIAGDSWGNSFWLENTPPHPARPPNEHFTDVGPNFFSDAGIPLIAGREILASDTAAAPKVVVVNESFAKKYFGRENPIGHRIGFGPKRNLDAQIVGVVKDIHYANVRQTPPPLFFRAWRQQEDIPAMTFYVRSDLPAKQIIPAVRQVMNSIDRDVPLERLRTFEEQIHADIQSEELTMRLAAAFAILATILAMLGLYGVMANAVARRTREIGIRMALGAAPRRIAAMILRELIWILGFGLGAGVPAALAATRLIESQLFAVHARDARIVSMAAVLLALTAAFAAWRPARRAASVNPVDALRCE